MTAYDENLRKVADALFVKADPKADQNVWDMAREVLKTVPQKEFQPTTHTATNYLVQANQPMPPLPEWLKHNPAGVDPDTIIVDPSKVEVNLDADPMFQELVNLRGKVALFQGDEAKIRQITEAEDSLSVDGEGQRESTVDAVKRVRTALKSALIDQGMVRSVLEAADDVTTLQVAAARMKEIKSLNEGVETLQAKLLQIRQHVGGHKPLVEEVADMAKENNKLRTELSDTVETASAAKLLKLVEKFDGRTLMDKVGNAVTWAGTHQARSKDLQQKLDDLHSAVRSNQEELREILGAQEPSEDDDDDYNWSEGESLTEAARRVVRERDEATEANIRHSCDKEMAAKAREIRATFADQLIARMQVEYDLDSNASVANVAQWLRLIADEERKEQNS